MGTLSELKWAALILRKLCTSLEQIKTANIKENKSENLAFRDWNKTQPLRASLTQSESSTLTYNTEWRMAFRTDNKGGEGGCRWTAHGGENTSTRWSNDTDTRRKGYGYAKLDTHMGSVFLQTFQPAEVDYSGNHKFRWGTRNVYKVSLKSKHLYSSLSDHAAQNVSLGKQWPCEWHEIGVTQRHGP